MDLEKDNLRAVPGGHAVRCSSLSSDDAPSMVQLSGFKVYTKWRCVLCRGHQGSHKGRDGREWGD